MSSIAQGAIYLIQNRISGGVYVGQTIHRPLRRWREHTCDLRHGRHGNPHLQLAWAKYGESAFEFCVIEICPTLEETNEAERFYIQYFRSIGVALYNCKDGGSNERHNEATKAKISAINKGKRRTDEQRARMGAALRGRKLDEEVVARRRGKKRSTEMKAKIAAANARREYKEETRLKMRALMTGRTPSAATRAKLSIATRGRPKPEQWKLKIRGQKRSQESRTLMSEIQSARFAKSYIFRSPDGELVRVNNQSELTTRYGVPQGHIPCLVAGRRKTHHGWSFVGFEEV